jgi:hypothetical protein
MTAEPFQVQTPRLPSVQESRNEIGGQKRQPLQFVARKTASDYVLRDLARSKDLHHFRGHELRPQSITAVIFDADRTVVDSESPGLDVLHRFAEDTRIVFAGATTSRSWPGAKPTLGFSTDAIQIPMWESNPRCNQRLLSFSFL